MVAQGAVRLIFPRPGKQRTGEGAGASRRPALIVSPAWPGNGRGNRRGAGALARLARLGKAGVLRRQPAATKRAPAARTGSLRSLSLFPSLYLPFNPSPIQFFPFPASGAAPLRAPKRGGRSSVSLRSSRKPGSLFMAPAAFLSLRPSGAGAAESGESGPNKKRQVGAMAATCRDGVFGRRRRGQLAFFLASSSASLPFSFASCSSCWRRWATYRLSKLMPVGSWTGGKPARRSMLVTVS